MQLQSLCRSGDLLRGCGLQPANIISRGQIQMTQRTDGIIILNGAGGIMGAAQLDDETLPGVIQLGLGEISVAKRLQPSCIL